MQIRLRPFTLLIMLMAWTMPGVTQQVSRPDSHNAAPPSSVEPSVAKPASDAQFALWREQIKAALFLPGKMPASAAREYGSFAAMRGVLARRITYAGLYGMRIPAIVYGTDHSLGKLPAVVVVAGHGGDKTTWYEVYAGLLYASAGAVVVTYDPVGEDERNSLHLSNSRDHDTTLPGSDSPARLGGAMIGDVISAVNYVASRPDVDPNRIAVVGYSMGSFHAAVAAALDPRIHALVLSGGGDLDGNGGSWDNSSKVMCQGGPYQALSFLPDKGAILYALHQRSGNTLIQNGAEDKLVVAPHHTEAFFSDLNARSTAIAGPGASPIEYIFYPNVGHRPSWVNRDAANWLNTKLHFPRWQNLSLDSLGETHIAEWAIATGAVINRGYETEKSEGGIRALGQGFPAPTRAQLQVVPEPEWKADVEQYSWQGLAGKILRAQGLPASVLKPGTTGNVNSMSSGSTGQTAPQ
jgi:dienelactone hydrolase